MSIETIQRAFSVLFKPWKNRILLMIGRGVLLASKDSDGIQKIQLTLLADEVKDQVENMAHFGFTSRAPAGSDIIGVCIGSNRDHVVGIATEHREYRFKNLGEGECAIYSKDGDYIHLKNGNVIDIKTKTLNIDALTEVNINTPTVNINASTGVNVTTPKIMASEKIEAGDEIKTSTDIVALNNAVVTNAITALSMNASTSLIVANQELNNYENHTHDYDDVGSPVNPRTTGIVNN